MRNLLCVAVVCLAYPAFADEAKPAPPPKPRVLVLPLTQSTLIDPTAARAFDARLLVALDDTGRVQTITHDEEPECTTLQCLAQLGTQTNASYVLQLSAVPESSTVTLFGTLVDVKSASAWRRIELPKVDPRSLARAPAELVPQVLGPQPGSPTTLAFVKPTSVPGQTMVTAVADQLTQLRWFKVLPLDAADRTPPTHRAELIISALDIAEPRRGICKWFEGTLTGTFAVTDLATGRLAWSKTITVEANRRVHFSSRQEIVDLLVNEAVTEWMSAFRGSGVLRPARR